MKPGLVVLLVAVVAAVAFGLYRRRVDGRFRGLDTPSLLRRVGYSTSEGERALAVERPRRRRRSLGGRVPSDGGALPRWSSAREERAGVSRPAALVASSGHSLGERATLLQFSSAFCAPCRATRVVLSDVAGTVPGVVHVEVDAEQHLAAVRELDILRTPTTIVLGPDGREVTRASGAPTRDQVLSALASVLPSRHVDGETTS